MEGKLLPLLGWALANVVVGIPSLVASAYGQTALEGVIRAAGGAIRRTGRQIETQSILTWVIAEVVLHRRVTLLQARLLELASVTIWLVLDALAVYAALRLFQGYEVGWWRWSVWGLAGLFHANALYLAVVSPIHWRRAGHGWAYVAFFWPLAIAFSLLVSVVYIARVLGDLTGMMMARVPDDDRLVRFVLRVIIPLAWVCASGISLYLILTV